MAERQEITFDLYINKVTEEVVAVMDVFADKRVELSNGEVLRIAHFMDDYLPYQEEA